MCSSWKPKRLYTLCFSSSYTNVVIICHFYYGQYLGYGRVRVFADLMCVHNTVKSGNYMCQLTEAREDSFMTEQLGICRLDACP